MSEPELSAALLAQLETMVRKAIREELADSGLRIDGDHADLAREDFRFTRKLRLFVEGTASKIGWTIIAAVLGGAVYIFTVGANILKGQ